VCDVRKHAEQLDVLTADAGSVLVGSAKVWVIELANGSDSVSQRRLCRVDWCWEVNSG